MNSYDISNIDLANETPEFNRLFAERVLIRLDRHQSFSWEQLSSFAKWLTASLLAVNGAGGLAALTLLKEGGSSVPGAFFGTGLLLALLSGAALQEIYNRISIPMIDQDNYWTSVVIDGTRDCDIEADLDSQTKTIMRFAFIPPTLGWGSGISFIAGAVSLGISAADIGATSSATCLVLERDMLSARPRRSNAPEMFQALGCKPASTTHAS